MDQCPVNSLITASPIVPRTAMAVLNGCGLPSFFTALSVIGELVPDLVGYRPNFL
jgi:hypothetical protein